MIELLQLEMDTLWRADVYGRPTRPHPLVAVALADGARAVRFGPDVPDGVKLALEQDPECRPIYEFARWSYWPSYVFPGVTIDSASPLEILTSDGGVPNELQRPEPWWEPEEWADLIAGRLGPWAFGMEGRRVVAICHTPIASKWAAEAGV